MKYLFKILISFFWTALFFSGCSSEISCPKSYGTAHFKDGEIQVDGAQDETMWQRIQPITDFTFPWQTKTSPLTEFRSFTNDEYFYFSFRVTDSNLVVLERLENPKDVTREDRVEIFFTQTPDLNSYFCIEIDPKGRVYDYRASFYRQFDSSWDCPGLEAKGRITREGYIVEAKIPIETFSNLGFDLTGGMKSQQFGLYRAEFSRTVEEPKQEWISWIDPGTQTPDFHVPESFGCFD